MKTPDHSPKADNIRWHGSTVNAAQRGALLRQRGCVLWFTGLSGSGKSTLACALEAALIADGHLAYVLDGDNIRHGLNRDLGFSPEDRHENIRRIGDVAALFADAGVIAITAFISPYREDRAQARAIVEGRLHAPFFEIFVDTPVEVCEQRDPKGLYRKARAGEIQAFTGISAPYEAPQHPDLALPTTTLGPDACVARLKAFLAERKICLAVDT